MRRDKRVFVLGEDVGVYGGAFKVTLGFQEEFGAWRVIDTPLSETAIVGGATGAAIMGMRPVAEMQFADFVSCAWDHLVTIAAKQRWRAGTPVPIVLRLPSGGGFSGGPFHSQNPESSFAHIPGLKCVCPATPEDAKGLLIAAIEDPNPVLFFEHKHLYRRIKGEVPDERYVTPIGKARIHQEGEDLTLVTWGAMVYTAEEAAKQLPDTSRSRSSTCARSCRGTRQAVLDSVRKTSKVLVLHEDTRTGGFGGEIAATIAEEAFEDLDAPVKRIAAPDTPGAVLARAREGVHPPGRRRRPWTQGAGRVLMATRNRSRRRHAADGRLRLGGHHHQVDKQVGDTIEADETLLEISTDKVDTEVPSPASGVVSEILVQEGETVEVGTVLARIGGEAGQRRPQRLPSPSRRPQPAAEAAERARQRRAGRRRSDAQPLAASDRAPCRPVEAPTNGKSFVSPVVARIAAEHGIDPSQVPGTGTGGRVTKKDILAFIESAARQTAAERRDRPAPAAPRPRPVRRPRPPPAPRTAPRPAQRRAGAGSRRRAGRRRDVRADVGDAPRHRRAHAPLARHLGARDERDRGRHVQGRRDPREAEEGVLEPPTASTRRTSRSSRARRSRRSATTRR